ncbi:hypothetical protein [Streptomyces sp. 891-h]|uniref:hypothetical protein n=1 Tax=Streptomyces sp. 891-h TaxID=2720714 RepID=UPI001FA9E3A3|nr:hypothetical protein [Streptomyces sp. 891-h]
MLRTAVLRSVHTRSALTLCAAGVTALALSVPAAQAAPAPAPQAAPWASAARADGPADTPSKRPVVRHRHTADDIHRFLTWFYGTHGPTESQRERFVSDFLQEKQAQNPDHDVILCAQNTPQNIEVGPVTVAQSAGVGWATVTAYWADGTTSTFTAYVALDSHPIELHEVVCAQ